MKALKLDFKHEETGSTTTGAILVLEGGNANISFGVQPQSPLGQPKKQEVKNPVQITFNVYASGSAFKNGKQPLHRSQRLSNIPLPEGDIVEGILKYIKENYFMNANPLIVEY